MSWPALSSRKVSPDDDPPAPWSGVDLGKVAASNPDGNPFLYLCILYGEA